MAKIKRHGSVKRFGTRYGRTTRTKVANIEAIQKKKHVCPFCNKEGVKRVSVGVWECKKCGSKFTGKAYTYDKKNILSKEIITDKSQDDVGDEFS